MAAISFSVNFLYSCCCLLLPIPVARRRHGPSTCRFYDECKRRYTIKLWKTFTDCFNCLPVAAIGMYHLFGNVARRSAMFALWTAWRTCPKFTSRVEYAFTIHIHFHFISPAIITLAVDEKIFTCHGGLSPDLASMEQIRRIMRPTDVPDQGLLCDLLWSDPDKDTMGWGENDRGVSFTFGAEVCVLSAYIQCSHSERLESLRHLSAMSCACFQGPTRPPVHC